MSGLGGQAGTAAIASLLTFGLLLAFAIPDPGGSKDWVLLVPGEAPSCAKSEEVCFQAVEAARRGWLPGVPAGVEAKCRPIPEGCFSKRSLCIEGFNCEGKRGRERK